MRWNVAAWAVCAAFALIAAFTLTDYGINWDEGLQREYGRRALRYYTSGFQDQSHAAFRDLRFYGPAFEMAAAALARVAPAREWDLRHALVALCALGAIVATMRIALLVAGPRAAFLASLFLVLTPHFYGNAFSNSKDIPFAAAFAGTVWAGMRLISTRRWPFAFACGTLLGILLAIRIGGVFLAGLLAAALAASWMADASRIRGDLQRFAVVIAIAWLVMVALWPWAHAAPLAHPLEALRVAMAFPDIHATLFEGSIVFSHEMPRRYVPKMFAITTPLPILVLTAVGVVVLVREAFRDRERRAAIV
ncbi:MAG TPA: hypothetical protein VFT12_09740, partial [Thermoanaerobaculia bacterium]|nr:hypothetical protein [Thermoanaerobaculia bacterium]